MVPLMNVLNEATHDNNWIDFELLADNKTFVGTSDIQFRLKMNPDTLESQGNFEYDDKVDCLDGVSHSRRLPDGTVISICHTLNRTTFGTDLLVYKMTNSNIRERVVIAQVP